MDTYTNEQLIAFCQEALRMPSYSGREQGVAELMKRKVITSKVIGKYFLRYDHVVQ